MQHVVYEVVKPDGSVVKAGIRRLPPRDSAPADALSKKERLLRQVMLQLLDGQKATAAALAHIAEAFVRSDERLAVEVARAMAEAERGPN